MRLVLSFIFAFFLLWSCSGCKAAAPSSQRIWLPELAVAPHAEFQGDKVTVHDVRDCQWLSPTDYIVQYYDRTYDLNQLESVDFIVSPFDKRLNLAHTMLSFGFGQGDFLALSVEVRKEQGQEYSPLKGFGREYELIYVLASERDVIQLSANQLHYPVYMHRARAAQPKLRSLLVDVLQRTNKLYREPEYYNTLSNNCTSNLVAHVNRITPGKIPLSYKTIFTGFSDEFAYDLGLIEPHGTFAQTREYSLINDLSARYASTPDYSLKLRDTQLRAESLAARQGIISPTLTR